MAKNVPIPDIRVLFSLLECNFETGMLTWKTRHPDMFRGSPSNRIKACKLWNSANAGQEAFVINSNGYLFGYINGKRYAAHRVIWKMANGYDPDIIDHKNRSRTDNRLCNLESGTISDNQKNMKIRADNTSGATGVSFDKRLRKGWEARINVGKKKVRLGRFESFEEALQARKSAEALNGYRKYEAR